jgi:predicted dehydrogenase
MQPVGISIVGASARSTMMTRFCQNHPDQAFITGAYDLIPQRCEFLFEHFQMPDAKVYSSLEEAVNDPKAQAVFVGTWDAAHAEPAIEALKAGKHVYCEKPLEVTLDRCDEIIAAARESKGVFYVGMNLRHGPVHEKLHEILASGQIGRLLTLEANEYYYGGRTYFRRWNRLRKYGGGLWITKACHDFDLLNWFAGGRAKRVSAFSSLSHYRPRSEAGIQCRACPVSDTCPDFIDITREPDRVNWEIRRISEHHGGEPADLCLYNTEKDTFDNGIAVVEYDNDVRATYTVNVVSARDTRQMRLMGTEGSAEGDMKEGIVRVWKRHTDETLEFDLTEQMKSGHGGADDRILNHFLHCCHTGEEPRSSWADGRASVELGLAVRQACDTGQVVELPSLNETP